jgi:hypothetical protein
MTPDANYATDGRLQNLFFIELLGVIHHSHAHKNE